jgi:hypothetical protein
VIRIQSLAFSADKSQMMLQLGWFDPHLKLSRVKMTAMTMETLKAFQTHMRLKGGTFDTEYMVNFCVKRDVLGPELCKVVVFDGGGGVGAEWSRPTDEPEITNSGQHGVDFDIDEFKERIKTYMDDQLANVQGLAAKNGHQDVVDAVTAELERRKV